MNFQMILIFGLLLGIAACGVMFWEYFKPLKGKEKNRLLLFTLLPSLSLLYALFQSLSILSKHGEPGVNILKSSAGTGLWLAFILIFGMAGVLYLVLKKASKRPEFLSRSLGKPPLNLTHTVIWAIRIYVAVLFMYSGFVKANDYLGFSYKLEEYFEVFANYLPFMAGFWKFFEGLSGPLAWFISVFEIALAVAILLGWRMRMTASLTMLMMIFFTILTAFSAITGEVTDCGCFGDALKLEPWESFAKDLTYMIMLTPLFLVRKYIRPFPGEKIAMALTVLAFIITGYYSWHTHEHLPAVDYRAYNVDKDLNKCTTIPGPDGVLKCKDFDEIIYKDFEAEARQAADTNFVMPTPVDLLKGDVLLMVMYDMDKSIDSGIKASVELASKLAASKIKVVAGTATGPSSLEKFVEKFDINYPFSLRDPTMLKTIIRSNPGFVLMQDGVIKGKWHHNDIPAVSELQDLLK